MKKQDIAGCLKQLRKASAYSANEAVEELKEYDITISAKTLYGYESGLSMPNADVFVALCRIYKCDNPMNLFGGTTLSRNELKLIKKYRSLDPFGQETVNISVDRETERTDQLKAASDHSDTTHAYTYMRQIACAGNGFIFDDIPTDTIEAPYMEGADFIIGVNGDSMEPSYYDGDLVYVKRQDTIKAGEIGIFTINNECYIKEMGRNGLISHNDKYLEMHGNEAVRCVGKVLGKVEK